MTWLPAKTNSRQAHQALGCFVCDWFQHRLISHSIVFRYRVYDWVDPKTTLGVQITICISVDMSRTNQSLFFFLFLFFVFFFLQSTEQSGVRKKTFLRLRTVHH